LPAVLLELRNGPTRPVTDLNFLIGSVPGCDLRLPGADLPPVLCLISRLPGAVRIRKLVPTQPVLLNGQSVTNAPLTHGDRLTLGSVELIVHIEAAAPPPDQPEQAGQPRPPRDDGDLVHREKAVKERREELAQKQRELEAREQELARVRQELTDIRQQLYDRYRERRDRLAALQEAVNHAARKVQERKRQLDAEVQERTVQTADLTESRQRLEEELGRLTSRQQQTEQDLARRETDCQTREVQLVKDREALEQNQAQYQADLVRLDRLQATLDQRQEQLQEQTRTVQQRGEQLQRTSQELEEQVQQMAEWHDKLRDQANRLDQQKTEQDAAGAQLGQRAAALEGQQAMLASLRTRLERLREELRREQQQVAEQQARLDADEARIQQQLQEAQQLRADLDAEKELYERERRQFDERRTVLETAVSQLRQAQDALAVREEEVKQRGLTLEAAAVKQAEEAKQLQAKAAQLLELQQRLTADRAALQERETTLAQADQARADLQEQLRRRGEELTARQRTVAELARKQAEDVALLETRRAEIDHERRQAEEQLTSLRHDLDSRAAELERLRGELDQRQEQLHRHVERLKEAGRDIGAARKALSDKRAQWEAVQQQAALAAARNLADFEAAKNEASDLRQQLPDLELRATAAIERLTQAREQLREHLGEIHAYARQSQEDIEALRAQVQGEAEQGRQQRLALQRARDEHRLAVAAFRQQMIEWQGQVTDMKRSLAHGETRLEHRQSQVAEQARQIDASSARLARQAEQLEEQERVVAEHRDEMERHLNDMREWYRRKLRELSQVRSPAPAPDTSDTAASPPAPTVLPITEEMEPGDQQLGDRLRNLDLVDADTLTSLLAEARQQRRSLRQALLAGGYLTLYQLALIETGNLDGLVLGPLRVIDRSRATPREVVYRVHDPRRGSEAILRHLTEAEMLDAVHPDEFRQRFSQAAALQHPHLAATLEVLEIDGRPAVLQEEIVGLPSTDWPPLVAAAGVWYRLLNQMVLGLHTIHQAGLVHGHLHAGLVLLTGGGVVKLSGLGEPPWLAVPSLPERPEMDLGADLVELGRIAAGWAALSGRRKEGKSRPLPETLQAILQRLTAADQRYPTTAALLEDLERAGAAVPANAEAWDRLLRYVREHTAPEHALRQSA
jgi:hypothetical protein